MTTASRRFFARLALIGVGAAAWRIWYILGPVTDRITRLTGDEFFYNWQARYFVEGRWFTNPFLLHNQHVSAPTALHPPLYTIFLAIPSALGFDTPTQSRIATALLGTATVVLIGVLARSIAGDRVGLIAALLAAAYPPLWSNDSVIGGSRAEGDHDAAGMPCWRPSNRPSAARRPKISAVAAMASR